MGSQNGGLRTSYNKMEKQKSIVEIFRDRVINKKKREIELIKLDIEKARLEKELNKILIKKELE